MPLIAQAMPGSGSVVRNHGWLRHDGTSAFVLSNSDCRIHTKTLAAIFANPASGNSLEPNLEWSRIESLLIALGCRVVEGSGSSVTFEKDGEKVFFHRPLPGKEALRYRVIQARDFLNNIGVTP